MRKAGFKYFLILFLSVGLIGCIDTSVGEEGGDKIFIDPEGAEKKDAAEFFESLELIPLELTQESALKLPSRVVEHNGCFYILDRSVFSVLKFTKKGKYLQTIQHLGHGPFEYNLLEDMTINPYTGHLEMLDPTGKIIVYDLDRKSFIEEYKLPFHSELRSVHNIICLNADTSLIHSSYSRNQLHWFSKSKGEFLFSDFPRRFRIARSIMSPLREANGQIYFMDIDQNKIHQIIGTEHKVFRQYDFGDHDLSRFVRSNPKIFVSQYGFSDDETENLVEEYNLVYPLSNYFFTNNTVQFMYQNSPRIYHSDHGGVYQMESSFDGVPLGWEQGAHIYGMIFHAENYRNSIHPKFMTPENKKVLDQWQEGDNIILMKFSINHPS